MDSRYFGIYRAVCTDNLDPEQRSRIRVVCPQVLGNSASDWAWPCLAPGWKNNLVKPHATLVNEGAHSQYSGSGTHSHSAFTNQTLPSGSDPGGHVLHQKTPAINEGVWIMFEGGDPDFPVWMGVF